MRIGMINTLGRFPLSLPHWQRRRQTCQFSATYLYHNRQAATRFPFTTTLAMLAIPVLFFNGKCVIVVPYWADPLALEADRRYMIHGQDNPASSVRTDSSITTRPPLSQRFICMRIACTLVLQCCSFGVSTFGVTQSKAIRHFDEFSANRTGSKYYFLNEGEAI